MTTHIDMSWHLELNDMSTHKIPCRQELSFLNFNGCTDEVLEWISNFIPHFYNGCNYLSMLGLKLIHVSKRGHSSELPCKLARLGSCTSDSNQTNTDSSEILWAVSICGKMAYHKISQACKLWDTCMCWLLLDCFQIWQVSL